MSFKQKEGAANNLPLPNENHKLKCLQQALIHLKRVQSMKINKENISVTKYKISAQSLHG